MDRLRQLMQTRGLSQQVLAKALGVHQTAVSQWLADRTQPSFRALVDLADFFGVSVDYLIGRTEDEAIRTKEEPEDGVMLDLPGIDQMDGHAFERWCVGLLLANGFKDVRHTPDSRDFGVDILAEKAGIRYAIQCKRFSRKLDNGPVQEVCAGRLIYRCQLGVVMTNNYFTKSAQILASATGTLLWDRETLNSMLNAAE